MRRGQPPTRFSPETSETAETRLESFEFYCLSQLVVLTRQSAPMSRGSQRRVRQKNQAKSILSHLSHLSHFATRDCWQFPSQADGTANQVQRLSRKRGSDAAACVYCGSAVGAIVERFDKSNNRDNCDSRCAKLQTQGAGTPILPMFLMHSLYGRSLH
jgi:hypothetical protein